MVRYSKLDQANAVARLREWLRPGDTVHCVLRHVSRSGMLRVISFHSLKPECERILDHNIALALGMTHDRQREGVRVSGCGMDMGFEVVYNLGRVLWPKGYACTGDGSGYEGSGVACASNDHSNGDRDYSAHQHSDSGYALRHRWL